MYYNVKISLNIIRYFADLLGDCFYLSRQSRHNDIIQLLKFLIFSIFSNNLSKNHDIFGAVNSLCM